MRAKRAHSKHELVAGHSALSLCAPPPSPTASRTLLFFRAPPTARGTRGAGSASSTLPTCEAGGWPRPFHVACSSAIHGGEWDRPSVPRRLAVLGSKRGCHKNATTLYSQSHFISIVYTMGALAQYIASCLSRVVHPDEWSSRLRLLGIAPARNMSKPVLPLMCQEYSARHRARD